MMKRFGIFVFGFIVGLIVISAAFYVTGYMLQSYDVQLYASEADQQRNFNIYIISSLFGGVVSGYFFSKKH